LKDGFEDMSAADSTFGKSATLPNRKGRAQTQKV
jgi:hypothetical protein